MKFAKRLSKSVLVAMLCLTLVGCANKAYVVHPGSPNTFDSQTYDVLVAADAAIQATKTALANGSITNATVAHNTAVVLNDTIKAYNIAQTTYLAYHAAASATPPTATQTQVNLLQSQTATLTTSVTALNNAKAGR